MIAASSTDATLCLDVQYRPDEEVYLHDGHKRYTVVVVDHVHSEIFRCGSGARAMNARSAVSYGKRAVNHESVRRVRGGKR